MGAAPPRGISVRSRIARTEDPGYQNGERKQTLCAVAAEIIPHPFRLWIGGLLPRSQFSLILEREVCWSGKLKIKDLINYIFF